jgi:hypothetical protein
MKKFALLVFNGDPLCFIHVLLNAIDMSEKGYEAKTQGLPLLEDVLGHPGMARFRDAGFEIITF